MLLKTNLYYSDGYSRHFEATLFFNGSIPFRADPFEVKLLCPFLCACLSTKCPPAHSVETILFINNSQLRSSRRKHVLSFSNKDKVEGIHSNSESFVTRCRFCRVTLHSTAYKSRCTVHSVLYTVYSLLYTVYSLLYTVFSLLYTVSRLLYTVYSPFYTSPS